MEKIHMAEFSNDFASCWNAAGTHLQAQGQGALNWLKATLTPPFLEHFSFRIGNQLFFVRVEDVDKVVESPGTLEGLLSVADGCKGHACIMYMKGTAGNWKCTVPGWGLVNARTEKLINPVDLVSDEKIVMTDWELQDFAVQTVRNDLVKNGKEILSWQSNPGIDPSIWFVGDSGPEWIVVRVAKYPMRELPLPNNIREIADQCASFGNVGHFAVVSVASSDDAFDPRELENTYHPPLIRGEAINYSYKGLSPIHEGPKKPYTPSADLSGELIHEFVNWFDVFLDKGNVMPKMFTGVNGDGSQFIIDFSRLELDSSKHLDFMRYVLHHENSIAFAYKIRMGVEVCKEPQLIQEQHEFYSGCNGSFHYLTITSKAADGWHDGYVVINQRQSKKPEIFFQEVLPNHYKREGDIVLFAEIWHEIRDKVFWRKRTS